MELEIELGDLKDSAVRRLLMKAIRCEMDRTKPMHKRKGEKNIEVDDATEDADEELEDLVSLSEEKRGKANPVEMDDEDMSDEAMEKLDTKPKKTPKRKKK